MGMLLFPHSWPVRCAKCGHTGTVTAATVDLAAKPLRCGSCGHRQPFAPETIVGARRRPNARGASQQAAALIGRLNR
jgi:DNA-directed RNA polymerase subunit RPC12/RpoP